MRASVDVTVKEDGSGVVKVSVVADADAVKAVQSGGAPIETAARLTDLRGAGWVVGAWRHPGDGSASIVLSKRFGSSFELASIVREISGAGGPLRNVRATRDATLLGTDYGVAGTIDLLHIKTGVPADQELVKRLSAQTVDVSKIDQQLLAQVKSSFALDVVVRLPGRSPVTVTSKPAKITRIDVVSSVLDIQRLVFIVAALGFGGLAVVFWMRGGRRRHRRRPRAAPKAPTRRVAHDVPRGAPPRTGPQRLPASPTHTPPSHGAPPHPDAPHPAQPTHAPPPAPHAPPPHGALPARPVRRPPPPRRPGEPPRR